MNGVTGRIGATSTSCARILAIRAQGGVEVGHEVIWPEPVLTERKLARLARAAGGKHGGVQAKLFLPELIKLAELIDTRCGWRSSRCTR